MAISKQKKFMFGIVYSMVLVFTLCFSGLVISSYIKEKQEFELYKQTWQYHADTNFTQTIETDEETGEQTVVYNISTPEQLAGMFVHSQKVQAKSVEDYKDGYKYKLTQNVDLSGCTWTSVNFSSTFYGNGFVIKNLSNPFVGTLTGVIENLDFDYVRISDSYNTYTGVVARYVNGGNIDNVKITSGSVYGKGSSSYVGGIAGYLAGRGKITNCSNAALVSSSQYVGGIVGYVDVGSVSNSRNYGYITSFVNNSEIYVGGIAGKIGSSNAYTYIKNCANRQSVSASYLKTVYVGGIAGYTDCTISECFNFYDNSSISGGSTTSETSYVGGIVGYSTSTIENCGNTSNVNAKAKLVNKGTEYTTGNADYNTVNGRALKTASQGTEKFEIWRGVALNFCGKVFNGASNTNVPTERSYVKTSVSSSYAGGIAGKCSGTIRNCYNTGTISSTQNKSEIQAVYTMGGYTSNRSWESKLDVVYVFVLKYTLSYNAYCSGINGDRSKSATNCYCYYDNGYYTAGTMSVSKSYVAYYYNTMALGFKSDSTTVSTLKDDGKSGGKGSWQYDGKSYGGFKICIDIATSFNSTLSVQTTLNGKFRSSTSAYKNNYAYDVCATVTDFTKTSHGSSISARNLGSKWTSSSAINNGFPYPSNLYW